LAQFPRKGGKGSGSQRERREKSIEKKKKKETDILNYQITKFAIQKNKPKQLLKVCVLVEKVNVELPEFLSKESSISSPGETGAEDERRAAKSAGNALNGVLLFLPANIECLLLPLPTVGPTLVCSSIDLRDSRTLPAVVNGPGRC